MVTSVVSLLVLGVLASCIYAWMVSCADCVSKGANNIDYFRERTEAEECMVLRMQDHRVQRSPQNAQSAPAKAA